jgi:hypothetical protein
MRPLVLAFALVASIAGAIGAPAVPDDETVAARRAALDLAGAWTNDGFKLRDGHFTGTFKVGEPRFVRVNLYAGNQYWFTLAGSTKAKKVSVKVFDETGKPVEFDVHQDDSRSAAGFSPMASGPYVLKIEEIEGEPSAFALVYSYR